jgi:hypothetical protein
MGEALPQERNKYDITTCVITRGALVCAFLFISLPILLYPLRWQRQIRSAWWID